MKFTVNPDWTREEALSFFDMIRKNKGYCPCKLDRTDDHKCPCQSFKEQEVGECHCGLYVKVEK